MFEIDYVEFGRIVREAREDKQMSQQALAEQLETSPQHLSNIERARKRPGIGLILKIAVFFNLDLNALFGIETTATKAALTATFSSLFENASASELRMCYALCETYLKTNRSNQ